MAKPRILLADEHLELLDALRDLVSQLGEVVGTVRDGQALVEAAQWLKPDIIFTDISMPSLNGLDATRALQVRAPQSKVIILTSYQEPAYVSGVTMRSCFVIATVTVFLAASACSVAKVCTREQAMEAEVEAVTLSDWPAIFKSFHEHKQCDDGTIAEGYSYSVAMMLSAKWEELAELHELTKQDSSFRAFVIKHIDETMTAEQERKIVSFSRSQCPATLLDLCQEIYLKALE